MNRNQLVNRVGALSIALAILLRFASTVTWGSDIPIFAQPELHAFLLRSQTGRNPTVVPTTLTTLPSTATVPASTVPPPTSTTPIVTKPAFTTADVKLVKMTYSCSYRPNLTSLLNCARTVTTVGCLSRTAMPLPPIIPKCPIPKSCASLWRANMTF